MLRLECFREPDHLTQWILQIMGRHGEEAPRQGYEGAPDAWIDPDSTKIGYEISFNRYFFKPPPMRSPPREMSMSPMPPGNSRSRVM